MTYGHASAGSGEPGAWQEAPDERRRTQGSDSDESPARRRCRSPRAEPQFVGAQVPIPASTQLLVPT